MAGHDGFELVTGHFHSIAKAGEFLATSRGVEPWPPSGLALYPIAVVDGLKARIAELERYVGVVERHLSQALGVPAKALGDLFTPAAASAQQKAPPGPWRPDVSSIVKADSEPPKATHAKPFPAKAMR